MKKTILFAFIAISIHAGAQTKPVKHETPKADTTQPKTLTLTGNVEAFQFLLITLDNPDKALHKDVKALEEWITAQLQAQLKEQAKK